MKEHKVIINYEGGTEIKYEIKANNQEELLHDVASRLKNQVDGDGLKLSSIHVKEI